MFLECKLDIKKICNGRMISDNMTKRISKLRNYIGNIISSSEFIDESPPGFCGV